MQPTKTPQHTPWLLMLSAITLALCAGAFGLWELRQNKAIAVEVATLKEKRIELITYIKKCNREISFLHNEIDSLSGTVHGSYATQRVKTPVPKIDQIENIGSSRDSPLSFDNGSFDKKLVALTFDGSSNSSAVGDILDTLKSRGVKATMFITGDFMKAFPDAVKRLIAEGHEVGNHTLTHPHLTSWAQDHTHTTLPKVTEAFLCGELRQADSIFSTLTGTHFAPIWRAPFGEKNKSICMWAKRCGYIHIGWRQGKTWRQGLDSNDWVPDEETPGFHTPEEVVDKILALAHEEPYGVNGGIILMHLGSLRKDSRMRMYRMLGTIIDDLKGLGYSFVSATEMLSESGAAINEQKIP